MEVRERTVVPDTTFSDTGWTKYTAYWRQNGNEPSREPPKGRTVVVSIVV